MEFSTTCYTSNVHRYEDHLYTSPLVETSQPTYSLRVYNSSYNYLWIGVPFIVRITPPTSFTSFALYKRDLSSTFLRFLYPSLVSLLSHWLRLSETHCVGPRHTNVTSVTRKSGWGPTKKFVDLGTLQSHTTEKFLTLSCRQLPTGDRFLR